jgi:putative transcriptional regulator
MAKKRKLNLFDDLHGSLQDAIAYESGEVVNLRVVELPEPPRRLKPNEIRRIRQMLHATQTLFATFLNVSPNTIRSWEQGTRRPQGADLKLLAIARKNPRILLEA